jgi:catecholate siderophore receptor
MCRPARCRANDKFTAPLLDTPKSVTVVTADVISQTGAVSLTDALRTVPGITIGAGEGGNPVGDNLFIRGYNAQTDTYIDGIRDAGSQSREIFNLEQVEVVKGPNSAYGGRSSAGGGVNLVSKTAQGYDFNNASVGIGSDKYRRVTGDLNRAGQQQRLPPERDGARERRPRAARSSAATAGAWRRPSPSA